MSPRLVRPGAALAVGLALVVSLGTPAMAQDAALDARLRVEVIASRPASDAPPGDGSGVVGTTPPPVRGASGAGDGGAGTPAPLPSEVSAAAPSPDLGEVDVAGMLFIGGLTATALPSFDPLGGTVTASFTVRNVSSSTIDSAATFTLDGPFGNRISTIDVGVAGLESGQSRVVSADLPGYGQWGFLTAHATLTPPDVVDGVALDPVARDASLFALPWFAALLAVGALAAAVIVRIVRNGAATAEAAAVAAA